MKIYSVIFALSRQINMQKYAKTINLLCAGNKVFVKCQAQGGVDPTPPAYAFVRVWRSQASFEFE